MPDKKHRSQAEKAASAKNKKTTTSRKQESDKKTDSAKKQQVQEQVLPTRFITSAVFLALFIFLIFPLRSGTVFHSTDDTGNGDLHCAKERKYRCQHKDDPGKDIVTEPLEQHSDSAANNTAGGTVASANVQVFDQFETRFHPLGILGQMGNAAAHQHKSADAHATHHNGSFITEGMNDK